MLAKLNLLVKITILGAKNDLFLKEKFLGANISLAGARSGLTSNRTIAGHFTGSPYANFRPDRMKIDRVITDFWRIFSKISETPVYLCRVLPKIFLRHSPKGLPWPVYVPEKPFDPKYGVSAFQDSPGKR